MIARAQRCERTRRVLCAAMYVAVIAASAALATPVAAQAGLHPEFRLSTIAGTSMSPKLAAGTAADNLVHAVWSEFPVGSAQQIYYSRSIDNGDSWSGPIALSVAPAPTTAVVPAIAANGNKVVVTWTNGILNGDIYYRISIDGGASWNSPPQALYPAGGYSRPSGALVDSQGRIHIAWFDSRATGYGQTYHTMSCDNGGTWSPLQRVNPHDTGVDNESPRLAEGPDGTIYMLYRGSRDGSPQRGWAPFDHYLLRSTAVACGAGVAWLYPSQRVSRGLPEDLGNTYGGQIVAGQNGRVHVAYWRETSGNNLVYRSGYVKPVAGQPKVPGFGNVVELSRFGPNHLEFDLNTAEVGGFGLGEDTSNITHAVFGENHHMNSGFQVGGIYYTRSADQGVSFEPRQQVSGSSEATGAHGLYHNGRFHMIWADFRDGNQGAEIYYRNIGSGGAPPPPPGPGVATVVANSYGPVSVQGATLAGATISNFQTNAVIQLGGTPGASGGSAKIDFQGLNLGPGATLTIRSGAPGQEAILFIADGTASAISGAVQAQGGNGAPPPALYLHNPNGITVNAGGSVSAASGLTVDTLGSTVNVGQPLVNGGVIDGGNALRLAAAKVTGGGAFKGNAVTVSTFGNANNPVNGAHYLANGLQIYPGSGTDVALTLNDYGTSPQVLNLMLNGNATVSMPSIWPAGNTNPPNSVPVPQGGSRPPGTPDPSYGGGQMIVQATGTLTLVGGGANDFAFAGGIVLKAGATLNLNGILVNQGWTTTGRSFQGVFFESPNIMSSAGNIQVLSNDLNWINFSTMPHTPVRTWQLVLAADGSARYVTADTVAPHLNIYSLVVETAANGGCWICLINTTAVNMQ